MYKKTTRLVECLQSASPVAERFRKLKEAGFIKNYFTVLDRTKIGRPVLVLTSVMLEKQTTAMLAEFEYTVTQMQEVQFCFQVSGKWNFVLHITAATPQDYFLFIMERINNLPNVAFMESSFVVKESKSFGPFCLGENNP